MILSIDRYDSAGVLPPKLCASSASRTNNASRSGSAYTATLPMPASLQARTTRTAISPRFATSTLVRGRGSAVTVGLAVGLSVDAPVTRQLLLGGGGRSLGGGPGRQSRARSRRRNAPTPA